MNKFYAYQNEVLELQGLETEGVQDYMEIGARSSTPICVGAGVVGGIIGGAVVLSLVSIWC